MRILNSKSSDATFSAVLKRSYTGTASISRLPMPEKWVQVAGYRFYSPELGRWTSRDPIGELGGINLFLPFLNCPSMFLDPVGLMSPELAIAIFNKIRECARRQMCREGRVRWNVEAAHEWLMERYLGGRSGNWQQRLNDEVVDPLTRTLDDGQTALERLTGILDAEGNNNPAIDNAREIIGTLTEALRILQVGLTANGGQNADPIVAAQALSDIYRLSLALAEVENVPGVDQYLTGYIGDALAAFPNAFRAIRDVRFERRMTTFFTEDTCDGIDETGVDGAGDATTRSFLQALLSP